MPPLPMHLHAVNLNSKIGRVRLTITWCLLRGAGGRGLRSKRGDIGTDKKITTGHIGRITPAVWGFQTLQSGVATQIWPTNGQIGYMNPAF